VKALHNLILTPDKENVYWVSICPRLSVGYFWKSRKIIGIWVKTDKSKECCEKHQQDTGNAHKSDDHFSHTQALSNGGRSQTDNARLLFITKTGQRIEKALADEDVPLLSSLLSLAGEANLAYATCGVSGKVIRPKSARR